MGWKIVFSFVFIILAITLLFFYWFIPFNTTEFRTFNFKDENSNFSLGGKEGMQFYSNMRFPDSRISYKIYNCPLKKEDDMLKAFNTISDITVLNFYSTNKNEEISITCESKSKIEGGLFIAGEGGPINITKTENFNVILNSKVLLIRDSECQNPNVAIHELLHVLGFNHSLNENNIMYPVSECSQTIGEDIPKLINELYSIQGNPDLSFENVSAIMRGKYLDINMTIRNNGLKDSEATKIIIYADGKQIKDIDLESIEVGYGRIIKLSNIWVSKISVNEIELFIDYGFSELDKNNNKIILKIK